MDEASCGTDLYSYLAQGRAVLNGSEVNNFREHLKTYNNHHTDVVFIEWKVLKLHYLDGLTGRQVAQRLRLSASRICQIHVTVLERLKHQLTVTPV